MGNVTHASDPQSGFFDAVNKPYDVIVISTLFSDFDPLRLCSHLRSVDHTRFTPIILVAEADQEEMVTRGLEIGINDYVTRPVEPQEFKARLKTQIRRKRYNDGLRASITQTIEMAVTDPLTGMHNRRYFERALAGYLKEFNAVGATLGLLILDLDHFKSINDNYGHDVGDIVLKEVALRMRAISREHDIVARLGGEEFAVITPFANREQLLGVAERYRNMVEALAIKHGNIIIRPTVSIGVATNDGELDNADDLFKSADQKLYQAKNSGRNRVAA